MGPGLLDIDPTVLLATIHLQCVWRFRFSPCPALCGSARDGVVRAGSAPELSKSLIRGIAQAGRGDKWPAPLPSASFLGWHLCVQGRTPQPPKICSETFRTPPRCV